MTPVVERQLALPDNHPHFDRIPGLAQLERWVAAALAASDFAGDEAELTVRVVDETESAALNERYRGKTGATNVLSFPFENPPGVVLPLLGDLVVCAVVVAREADEQGKDPVAHWAHMVVHGVLHLRGFDHVDEADADAMEALEIAVMRDLGYDNPYVERGTDERRPN